MSRWNEEWVGGAMPPVVDLHLHTTASDGLLSPADLIKCVASTGLRMVAVTDHDSTEGLDEAFAAAASFPDLTLIPGVELSTSISDSEVHMVGLFIDYRDEELQERLEHFRSRRERSIRESVEKLNDLGIGITFERVKELSKGSIGRPHIADALIEAGHVSGRDEAFEKYLGDDGPARTKKTYTKTAEGIDLIHSVGGVAVIAHPRTVKSLDEVLPAMVEEGIDGIEIFAEKYGKEDRERYAGLARDHGLVPAGGSDYHAKGSDDEILPGNGGMSGPTMSAVEELRERAEAHRSQAAT